ncbi:MAG: YhgE/Pip family protein, partial [Candidatus Saccharimonas sp.]
NLSTGATTLASPLEKSLYGYNTLRAANTQLYAGSQTLSDGLSRALNGSQQLAVGANTLNANSSALNSGAVQLENGTVLLTNKLADAATKVKLQPTGEATQSQLASPVTSRESKKGDVPNYGYALAPYVLSLGLFVGALVFNVIYPIRKTFSEQENAFRWWLAKASIAGVAAFVQATILMLVMVFILGLQPDHPLQFSLAIYLTSFVYMSIVSLLVIMLDNVGRFLSMVLLVLQLGASEGTFPIQTAPAFFQAINPFLPMTYSIHTLRESISGGLSTQFYASSMIVLLIILFIANGLLIAFFMHRGRRSFAHTSVDGDN